MTETPPFIKPGSTIGILGGGQLGRMLALAALQLGYKVHIYCTNTKAPAFDATHLTTIGDYDDEKALSDFARSVDIVTFEFESIPARALEIISAIVPAAPGVKALAASQDRLSEKRFIESAGVECAPYKPFESADELEEALRVVGRPAVAKRRLMSYDGKGQMAIRSPKDAKVAGEAFDGVPSVLEKMIPFDREVSVLVARSWQGDIAAYPVVENVHENHVLARSIIPATLSPTLEARAKVMATRIANALNYVGLLAVEMFIIDKDQTVMVNEIAPRVHNSGHWTIEGAVTSQFEQHIRAICGLPLGSTEPTGDVEMVNLFGPDVEDVKTLLANPAVHYHNYGKENRPGRKTGHYTVVKPFGTHAAEKAAK